MKKVLKIFGGLVPFLATHLLCCGAALYFLWSSGLLLVMAREGRNRIFLMPMLAVGVVFFFIGRKHKKSCQMEGHYGWGDKLVNFLFFVGFYLMISLAFMVYVFIPWWIPGYEGGLLLP